MIVQKGSLGLRRRLALADHILGDGSFRDHDTEHLELTMYAGCTPKRVLPGELADEVADLRGNSRSPGAPAASRFPRPVQTQAPLVPMDQRIGLNDGEDCETAGPDPVQPHPEHTLVRARADRLAFPRG